MTEQHLTEEEIALGPLPDWAEAHITDGSYLHRRASLPTKDGRRCGNAVILEIGKSTHTGQPLIIVCSDAGNVLKLSENELKELFHPPRWTMSCLLDTHQQAAWEIDSFVHPDFTL